MNKLKKNIVPTSCAWDSFECFGPVATKDGQFNGTMMADLGCFKQEKVDSNKFYFGAIVKTPDEVWYAYFEHGRTGSTNNSFQFYECNSKEEAEKIYIRQLRSKNDKRGIWNTHASLGQILQPKPGKDLYLVRPQVVRQVRLTKARTIANAVNGDKKGKKPTNQIVFDDEANSLLHDLGQGTTQYTRSQLVGGIIPSQESIDAARELCDLATTICNEDQQKRKSYVSDPYDPSGIVCSSTLLENNKDLEELTNMLYSKIPRAKPKKVSKRSWILIPENILKWRSELDAFESSLQGQSFEQVGCDFPFDLETIYSQTIKTPFGKWIKKWFKSATHNKHSNVRGIKIKNIWEIGQNYQKSLFNKYQLEISQKSCGDKSTIDFQPNRTDISNAGIYDSSCTCQLFHGSKTINVKGILNKGLRLPKTLPNVAITGALYGGGTYVASDWKKSANYTSLRNSYWARGTGGISNRGAFLLICDIVLGKYYIPSQYERCHYPPKGHDSIFAKGRKSGVLNDEFVVFNTAANLLRYLVELE